MDIHSEDEYLKLLADRILRGASSSISLVKYRLSDLGQSQKL